MEEGGLRTSAPYASSAEIAEQENERSLGELEDRVKLFKRVRGFLCTYTLHSAEASLHLSDRRKKVFSVIVFTE